MQFSPDGTQLALSCPTSVWFYDVKTGKELSLFTGKRGTLTFSPDGRFLAKGGDQFQLWEIATQREVPLKTDFPDVNVLRFSSDHQKCDKVSRYTLLKVKRRTYNGIEISFQTNTIFNSKIGGRIYVRTER